MSLTPSPITWPGHAQQTTREITVSRKSERTNYTKNARRRAHGRRHTKGYTLCRSITITLFLLSTATFWAMTSYAQKLKHIQESLNPKVSKEISFLYLLIKSIKRLLTHKLSAKTSLCWWLLFIGKESLRILLDLDSSQLEDSGTYRVQYH